MPNHGCRFAAGAQTPYPPVGRLRRFGPAPAALFFRAIADGGFRMIDEMKALLQAKTMCVFATVSGGRPHCSLMAYAAGEDGTEIYLATLRSTRKFRNVAENPAVSLLVDTREELPHDRARALTVEGACRPIVSSPERERARTRLSALHPHLRALLDDPGCEILSVRVTSFLLLKGITEAHRVDV
jgi:hypothetical protein